MPEDETVNNYLAYTHKEGIILEGPRTILENLKKAETIGGESAVAGFPAKNWGDAILNAVLKLSYSSTDH